MHKLAWMDSLKKGDTVVINNAEVRDEEAYPIKVTRVGRKSVFTEGDRRFSKWNGFQVKSDGRPIYSIYNYMKPIQITPMLESNAISFLEERERLVKEVIATDFDRIGLKELRRLHQMIERMAYK